MRRGRPDDVATLIRAADGELIGRTRLQKTVCLLELVGLGFGFSFAYHLYGPYSEELSVAASDADALGLIKEEEDKAAWGGRYSVFRSVKQLQLDVSESFKELVQLACKANSIELELAVTAAFLASSGEHDPWAEVAQRKPEKATKNRLGKAKNLYSAFAEITVPRPLPAI